MWIYSGMPWTVTQMFIMGSLITLENFNIYNYIVAHSIFFLINSFNLAFPPYAISKVLIERLGCLEKNIAKANTAKNIAELKMKISFFKQNATGTVIICIKLVAKSNCFCSV
eukprot:snap_masked-scaffold_25-processed-gene-1.18-mRNA-1 protein AED:1.00 eAED:1.00 QI:0/0/0/0/1/1/2/0/111